MGKCDVSNLVEFCIKLSEIITFLILIISYTEDVHAPLQTFVVTLRICLFAGAKT
jgi:hypothetical protein